ncbi:phage tail tip lysozyme [Candidatus Gracilibacteria bacterium]|jgi:hypothetical protein|nr:phage tail tip lysozyme [Candidatus Gracilibacteria bacterium]
MSLNELLTKTLGIESIEKALGFESFKNIVPSLKKAYEVAFVNNDKSFPEKISMFLTSLQDEMKRLDAEKNGITADAQGNVEQTLGINIPAEGNVVDQMKMQLNGSQKNMAYLIENIFTTKLKAFDKDLSDGAIRNIVAAALINAYSESRFNPKANGDGGASRGLFQIQPWGGSIGYRENPENNINLILDKEVLKSRGEILIARAKEGADVSELTALFSKYIERPGNEKGEMTKRAALAKQVFKGGVAPQPSASTEVATGENINFSIDLGGIKKGFCDLQSGQKTWFFGSSTVVGMPKSMGGRLGVTALSPREFLQNLENNWWDKIQTAGIRLPQQIIITGMAQNSVNNDASVKKTLEDYEKIKRFLSSKGVSVVKFITVQPSDKNGQYVAKFNDELKRKYGSDCIDTTSETTTAGGTKIKNEFHGDGIHLNEKGKKAWNDVVSAALNEGQETA